MRAEEGVCQMNAAEKMQFEHLPGLFIPIILHGEKYVEIRPG